MDFIGNVLGFLVSIGVFWLAGGDSSSKRRKPLDKEKPKVYFR